MAYIPVGITSIVNTVPSSVIVGASIFGQLPAGTAPLGSIATLQGTNPWITNINHSIATVIIGGSVASATTNSSVMLLNSANVIGSVATLQGTNPWIVAVQAQSIVGTYAEDSGHTTADKGIFTLGVRNDTIASFVSADLEYTPRAVDSAGRTLIRPFSAEESRIEGYHSVVSTSVTTLIAAAGAGLRNYVTDFFISNTGETTTLITFKDGLGSILGYTIAPAGGGSNAPGLAMPIRTGANASFDFQPTAASSIIYATVKGFKAP